MKTITLLIAFIGCFARARAEEESFVCQVKAPNIKIEIPGIPQIKMTVHPLHDAKPHLRLAGEKEGYVISIATPTADAGMTAEECAKSIAGSLLQRYDLNQDNAFFGPAGKDTFQFRFILSLGDGVYQMNSHILSGYEGTHCVNVHITKVTKQKADFDSWLKGFPNAAITNVNKKKEEEIKKPNNTALTDGNKPSN